MIRNESVELNDNGIHGAGVSYRNTGYKFEGLINTANTYCVFLAQIILRYRDQM